MVIIISKVFNITVFLLSCILSSSYSLISSLSLDFLLQHFPFAFFVGAKIWSLSHQNNHWIYLYNVLIRVKNNNTREAKTCPIYNSSKEIEVWLPSFSAMIATRLHAKRHSCSTLKRPSVISAYSATPQQHRKASRSPYEDVQIIDGDPQEDTLVHPQRHSKVDRSTFSSCFLFDWLALSYCR